MKGNVFFHTGDLGDVIASLPAVRAIGGGHYRIGPRILMQRECMRGARFESIKPLLDVQPYVLSCEWSEKPEGYDFSTFRHDLRVGESLAHWQARHLGVEISTAPWLLAPVDARYADRIVIARSERHHGRYRMWQKVVSRNKDALFVGLPAEHRALQNTTQAKIEFAPTRDLLELASIIAGCRLFIGNQSCPWWIAFGLGVPTIQEVFPDAPNSRIERDGARYWDEPPFELP